MERVGRGQSRVEPDGSGLGLAELAPVRPGEQRRRHGVHPCPFRPPDQLHTCRDVAPLVATTELEGAAVVAIELQVIHRLQQDIRELGVGHPGLESLPDNVAGQHPVDWKVLADVAKKVQYRHRTRPVQVVDDPRGIVAGEVEELRHLAPNALHPAGNRLLGIERPLGRFLRVTDQPC